MARAAECPESSPEDAQERRKLAKEWFSTAESAENAGNDAEATRAYACSYKMVAHPYTAFNLARVAERSGDSELALKMYRAYLTLKPDAQEREKVKGKIKALEDSITGGGAPKSLAEGAATQGSEDGSVTPPPGEGAAAEACGCGGQEAPRRTGARTARAFTRAGMDRGRGNRGRAHRRRRLQSRGPYQDERLPDRLEQRATGHRQQRM